MVCMRGFTRRSRWVLAFSFGLLALSGIAPVGAAPGFSPTQTEVRAADDAGEAGPLDDVASQLSQEAQSAPLAPEPASDPPAPPIGAQIAWFAQQYLGYPYAWAGNGPWGFDCAGLAQFVVLNVTGIDIGHGLTGQPGAGAWVEWGAWQPGDLIFFQNTYQAGLSHVGIYIGDGLMVHAENESTGVTIDSVYSDYYGPRYWGAVRVAW
jgi:cell wall-associated NlpC family hydrolase